MAKLDYDKANDFDEYITGVTEWLDNSGRTGTPSSNAQISRSSEREQKQRKAQSTWGFGVCLPSQKAIDQIRDRQVKNRSIFANVQTSNMKNELRKMRAPNKNPDPRAILARHVRRLHRDLRVEFLRSRGFVRYKAGISERAISQSLQEEIIGDLTRLGYKCVSYNRVECRIEFAIS